MVKNQFLRFIIYTIILIRFLGCTTDFSTNQFTSNWSDMHDRIWIGSEYWANPLQDWQLKNGRLECVVSGGDRNVFLLTHKLKDKTGPFEMSVRFGQMDFKENQY